MTVIANHNPNLYRILLRLDVTLFADADRPPEVRELDRRVQPVVGFKVSPGEREPDLKVGALGLGGDMFFRKTCFERNGNERETAEMYTMEIEYMGFIDVSESRPGGVAYSGDASFGWMDENELEREAVFYASDWKDAFEANSYDEQQARVGRLTMKPGFTHPAVVRLRREAP